MMPGKMLYRACSREEAYWTVANGAVGGVERQESVSKPSKTEAIDYVGLHEGCVTIYKPVDDSMLLAQPEPPNSIRMLAEFTEHPGIAVRFAESTGWIIAIVIENKYLTKGSNLPSEQGWIARVGAPLIEAKIGMQNGVPVLPEIIRAVEARRRSKSPTTEKRTGRLSPLSKEMSIREDSDSDEFRPNSLDI